MAFPHSDEVLVQSFFNYYDFDGETLDEIAHLSESEQMRRFGGSLGPALRLEVEGSRTRIIGSLGHWHIPLAGETLPLTDRELIRRGKHNDTSTGGYAARTEAERKYAFTAVLSPEFGRLSP